MNLEAKYVSARLVHFYIGIRRFQGPNQNVAQKCQLTQSKEILNILNISKL